MFFCSFFYHKFSTAPGAGLVYGFVPCGKGAFGKTVTPVKYFTPARFFFNNVPGTTRFGACNAQVLSVAVGQGLGVFTFRVTAAGQKIAVTAPFHDHGAAALVADYIGGLFGG